jgi:hypothetical protein
MAYSIDLKDLSNVAIHFFRPDEFKTNQDHYGLVTMEGNIAKVRTEKDLFAVIAPAMKFPDYFGNNWDALDECLGDMNWMPASGYLLILYDATKGWSDNPYVLGRFVTIWLEAAKYWTGRQTPFHLVFVM